MLEPFSWIIPPVRRSRDKTTIQTALQSILDDPPDPPPSLRSVARQLGEPSAVVQHWFPDLCRAISQRYLAHQQVQRELRALQPENL